MSLKLALGYVERGLALLPLAPRSKVPNVRVLRSVYGDGKWTRLTENPATEDEVRAWHARDPATGIGVVTGAASNLVVLDVDGSAPAGLVHPPTTTVETARGNHRWFTYGSPLKTRKFAWGELRADGSYVVAPDSVHSTGHRYRFAEPMNGILAPLEELTLPYGERQVLEGETESAKSALPKASALSPLPSSAASYALPSYHPLGVESGIDPRRLGYDEGPVLAAMRALGIEAEVGEPFLCVLPGHEERNPSASVYRSDLTGLFMYHDWHAAKWDGPEWLELAEVRASIGYGTVRKFRKRSPEKARWYSRLFYEAGCLEPVAVAMPAVPSTEPDYVHRVAHGFSLLVGLRLLTDPEVPAPFAAGFAGAWCQVNKKYAWKATARLLHLGVLEVATIEKSRQGRRMKLYRPGAGT